MIMKKRFFGVAVSLLLVGAWVLAPTPALATQTTVNAATEAGELDLFNGSTGILDVLYGAGNYSRVEDFGTTPNDQVWSALTSTAMVEAKYAGADLDFGYFPGASGGSFTSIITGITGTDTGGAPGSGFSCTGSCSAPFSILTDFRWGIQNSDTFSSLMSDNTDTSDHMVTFLITGGASAGNYVIAWEDRVFGGTPSSDGDYNDLVVEIAIPEPATLLLLGSGLFGLGLWGRRKQKQAA